MKFVRKCKLWIMLCPRSETIRTNSVLNDRISSGPKTTHCRMIYVWKKKIKIKNVKKSVPNDTLVNYCRHLLAERERFGMDVKIILNSSTCERLVCHTRVQKHTPPETFCRATVSIGPKSENCVRPTCNVFCFFLLHYS